MVQTNPSKTITDVLANIVPVYPKVQIDLPIIDEVKDWFSNTVNSLLSHGNFCEIIGDELKIYDEPESQGVWFVSKTTGDEIECARILKNEPKTLVVQIPALEKGEYQVLIRNRSRSNKALRTELSDIVLIYYHFWKDTVEFIFYRMGVSYIHPYETNSQLHLTSLPLHFILCEKT